MSGQSRIAPFPVEQIEGTTYKAKWEDIAKAARALRTQQQREVPEHLDVRSAGFWFKELDVLWNEESMINAYIEDSEGSPWVVEWEIA